MANSDIHKSHANESSPLLLIGIGVVPLLAVIVCISSPWLHHEAPSPKDPPVAYDTFLATIASLLAWVTLKLNSAIFLVGPS
jgi:hypothetical protein